MNPAAPDSEPRRCASCGRPTVALRDDGRCYEAGCDPDEATIQAVDELAPHAVRIPAATGDTFGISHLPVGVLPRLMELEPFARLETAYGIASFPPLVSEPRFPPHLLSVPLGERGQE